MAMQRCLGCMREFGREYDVCPHCGYIVGTQAASKNHLAPGTVLQSRYILGRALGQGGFGITYIAWDNKIGRAVAIKEYMPNALASRMMGEKEISCYNEEARRQFDLGLAKTRKEAHALSRFDKLESVVKVYDCIEENGTAYIVMELLRGRTVKEVLTERGKLSFAETMRIMTPVLGTLDAMHGVGMIHRDVAPDNIFVCDDGQIKLLDFGAARVVSSTDEKTLSVMLKAGYAPVEQYSGKAKQGPYTDVYAASATMYKMLTGETPPDSFSREKDGGDLKALSQTDVPPSAQETILHGMAQDAADRIQSTRELLAALQKDAPENVAGIDPKQFLQAQKKKQTKKIARAVIAAALVLCVVIGTVAAALHFKKPPEPPKNEEKTASVSVTVEETAPEATELTQPETTTEEATTEEVKEDTRWIAAYKEYLIERIRQDKAEAESPNALDDYSPRSFSLIYLDDDSIPELVVSEESYHSGTATLITFQNGKLQSFPGLGLWGTFQYKEREGIIVEEDAHSGVNGTTVWHLTQGLLKCVWSGFELHPELIYADGGEPEYYIQNVNDLETFRKTQDESDYEKLHASEKKISESEYKAVYNEYVPAGMTEAIRGGGISPSMTQNNVNLYFNALTKKASIPLILHGYDQVTFSGTLSEKKTGYNGSEYYDFQLDQPIIVQFKDDAFPALLTDVRISADEEENITIGHTTIQGHPNRESDGLIWLTWIIQ